MSSQDAIARVAVGFADALAPLGEALQSPDRFGELVGNLGWPVASQIDTATVRAALAPLPDDLGRLQAAAAAFTAIAPDAPLYLRAGPAAILVASVATVMNDVRALVGKGPNSGWPPPLNNQAFWVTFPTAVVDALVYEALQRNVPRLFGVLYALGLVVEEPAPPPVAGGRSYRRKRVMWSALEGLVQDPAAHLAATYKWGTEFDYVRLLDALERLVRGFAIPTSVAAAPAAALDEYWDATAEAREGIEQLDIPLGWKVEVLGGAVSLTAVDLIVLPIPPKGDRTAAPQGIGIIPSVVGQAGTKLNLAAGLDLVLTGGFASRGTFRVEVRPGGAAVAVPPGLGLNVEPSARLEGIRATPLTILGSPSSSRIEVSKWHVSLSCRGPVTEIEVVAEAVLDEAALVLDPGEGDSFVQYLLGALPVRIDLACALSWSSRDGLRFNGKPGIQADLPVKQSAGGILVLESLRIRASGHSATGAVAEVSAAGRLTLGPVTLAVDHVGIRTTIEPRLAPLPPGNVGPAEVGVGLKPPDGVGLSIAAGPLTGAGFLSFDPVKGQYAGVVHLSFQNIVLNAVGILTTKLPGGQRGFSLLVIVTAQFEPVQLGFGFALTGVGGLVGINRAVAVDELRSGLKSGAFKDILFSRQDPVPRAAEIVTRLSALFPPAADQLVLGPMAQITWGTPPVVTIDVALLIQLPAPVKLVVLGRIGVRFPPGVKDADAQVRLNLNILGVVDFGAREAAVDALLHDSTLMKFPITGGMALRANWGEKPAFALAVGGFHPQFVPPPGFPKLSRVSLSLSTGDNPRARLEAYIAVTANTVQFGANVDFSITAEGFTLEMFLGFDALLQLSPFEFRADIAGRLTLKQGGTALLSAAVQVTLSGPAPWHIWAKVTFEIVGFKFAIEAESTFGDRALTAPAATTDLWTLLQAALSEPRNWSADLPAEPRRSATLRPLATPAPQVAAHPLAELAIDQRVLPLGRELDRLGSALPAADRYFAISSVTIGGTARQVSPITSFFAPAQHWNMSDADKLAAPSFERFPSGVRLQPPGPVHGTAVELTVDFDTVVIGADGRHVPTPLPVYTLPAPTAAVLAEAGGAGDAERRRVAGRYRSQPLGLTVGDTRYVVASSESLAPVDDVATTGGTHRAAVEALRARTGAGPSAAGRFVVATKRETVA